MSLPSEKASLKAKSSVDIFDSDRGALITKVGASFIACPRGIECCVMGEDFESDHVKLMEDINKEMEDFIVTGRAESILPAAGRI